MPRKVFTAGEVLAAADVNTFLMDQSVMSFAGTAARGSAIGTATEGMLTYLADSDALELYNGSAWVSATPASGGGSGNAIINGAFEINQRGFTSSTALATTVFGFDRWGSFAQTGTVTTSAQTFTLGSAPIAGYEARNFYRTITSGQSGANAISVVVQAMEGVRTFAGQTVTVSFFAKAGSGTPQIGVAFDQGFGSGGSPSATVQTHIGKTTLTTSWVRHTLTATVPSIAGKTIGTANDDSLRLVLWFSAGTDYNAQSGSLGIQSNTFDIWGVQVEAGSEATAFRRNANSIEGELAACQRYYQHWGPNSRAVGYVFNTVLGIITFPFTVEMRVQPSIFTASSTASNFRLFYAGTDQACSVVPSIWDNDARSVTFQFQVASGLTVGQAVVGRLAGTTGTFLGASAEL